MMKVRISFKRVGTAIVAYAKVTGARTRDEAIVAAKDVLARSGHQLLDPSATPDVNLASRKGAADTVILPLR